MKPHEYESTFNVDQFETQYKHAYDALVIKAMITLAQAWNIMKEVSDSDEMEIWNDDIIVVVKENNNV